MLFCFCSENINANDVASVLMCVSFGVIIDVMRMSILIMVSSVRPPLKISPIVSLMLVPNEPRDHDVVTSYIKRINPCFLHDVVPRDHTIHA
jgi:hypothetical protein